MAYDTSENNRLYFDSYDDWCIEVYEAGGISREGRGILIAEGWYGEMGEFDIASGEGWIVEKFSKSACL